MQSQASTAFENLGKSMVLYASMRAKGHVLGQFWDEEGCLDPQIGVYGVSCWVYVTHDIALPTECSLEDSKRINTLRDKCVLSLKHWVAESETNQNTQKKEAQELQEIVPKMASAYMAFKTVGNSNHETDLLKNRLLNARNFHDGSWNGKPNSQKGNAVITAFVLRCIGKDGSLRDQINTSIAYLEHNLLGLTSIYEKLYVLNTILELQSDEPKIKSRIKKSIISTIRNLYLQVYYNPVSFPNPINVDYHANGRTRYFRLQSDLILLESLILISDHNLIYVQTLVGAKVFSHLMKNLNGQFFSKDTSAHRAGAGFVLYTHQVLQLIRAQTKVSYNTLTKIWSWFICSFKFGQDFSANLIFLITSLISVVIAIIFTITPLLTISYGILGKTLTDAGKGLLDLKKFRQAP